MKINVLTLFPEMFEPVVEGSILGRAQKKGLLEVKLINIRDFSQDKHKKADDYPFGGGVGMVMMADPVFRAMDSVNAKGKKAIYMSPRGKIINRQKIQELSEEEEITILCGHYEGIDERIIEYWNMEELSIGDYVLTGGELPAMVLIDAVARFIPEVLSGEASAQEESVYSGLLEYPQYTKPREYMEMPVPEVLLNGNHKLIALWKFRKSLEITLERRPDLFEKYVREHSDSLSRDELKILKEVESTAKKV